MPNYYQVGTTEFSYSDSCGSCPSEITFDDSANYCGNRDAFGSRCFRGQFDKTQNWLTYDFEVWHSMIHIQWEIQIIHICIIAYCSCHLNGTRLLQCVGMPLFGLWAIGMEATKKKSTMERLSIAPVGNRHLPAALRIWALLGLISLDWYKI